MGGLRIDLASFLEQPSFCHDSAMKLLLTVLLPAFFAKIQHNGKRLDLLPPVLLIVAGPHIFRGPV